MKTAELFESEAKTRKHKLPADLPADVAAAIKASAGGCPFG